MDESILCGKRQGLSGKVQLRQRVQEPAVSGSTSKFNDVIKGAFYESAVTWAVEENITSGVSANKFAPNDVCTRAQTVTFLYRFANK